jgi:hypothetical protein
MKYSISHIAPLRAAFIIAVLYGAIPALFSPITLMVMDFIPHLGTSPNQSFVAIFLLTPAIHAGLGFAYGLIGAVVFNIIAKWTGGFILEIQDAPQKN